LYEAFPAGAIADLERRGHRVTRKRPPLGHPVMLVIDPQSRKTAAGDPAARRHARAN
jgi:hypothetical protein